MKNDKKTFQVEVEYTDTFGGEPNYCWVKRETLTVPEGTSELAIVRRAKAAMGLSGVACRKDSHGELGAYYPYGTCTVMFINPVY